MLPLCGGTRRFTSVHPEVSCAWSVAVTALVLRSHEERTTGMASGGKKKTTFAKLAREQKLRERRRDKQAKRDARKRASEIDLAPLPDATPPAGDS